MRWLSICVLVLTLLALEACARESNQWKGFQAINEDGNINKGIAYYEKGCVDNEGGSCLLLAQIYSGEIFDRKDTPKAFAYFKKACDHGLREGCYQCGFLATNEFLKINEAEEYYLKACTNNHPAACNNLGVLYNDGRITKDRKDSVPLFQKSCELGNPKGCNNMASLYYNNREKESDYDLAAYYYRKGCHGREAEACFMLALMIKKGQTVVKSKDEENNGIYKKACQLGHNGACINYAVGLTKDRDNMEERELLIKKALATTEYRPEAHYNLACIYLEKGDLQGTLLEIKEALFLKPSLRNKMIIDVDFESIRNNEYFKEMIRNAETCGQLENTKTKE